MNSQGSDDAFFICDVGDIIKKVARWRELLPRVAPFYGIFYVCLNKLACF